jgi:tetratricopeptide (TPR) repeat protein
MLLQRCIKNMTGNCLMLLTAALLLSACGGGTKPDAEPRQEVIGAAASNSGTGGAVIERAEVSDLALAMFEQATAVMASGDFLDAELRFKEFLLRYPAYPGAHVNLAIIHINNDNDAAAQASIDAALALNPAHPAALNQQGMLFRKNGKFIEAEAAYLKAVTASPNYALAHYNLGVLNELYLQRLDTALQHFEQYQSLVGEDKQVEKWIADLRRRVTASQRTANVAE